MSIVSTILTGISKTISVSEDIIIQVSQILCKELTLNEHMHLRIACNAKPSAQRLAFALQNSLPCLVGLNMDSHDMNYYLQIARTYFDPFEPSMYDETMIYHHIARNGENQDVICLVPVNGRSNDYYIKQLLMHTASSPSNARSEWIGLNETLGIKCKCNELKSEFGCLSNRVRFPNGV